MTRAAKVLRLMRADGRKGTQTAQVLAYLLTHKNGITTIEAFERYNATRLGSIIYELRHKYGIDIDTIVEVSKGGHTYARYILSEGASA